MKKKETMDKTDVGEILIAAISAQESGFNNVQIDVGHLIELCLIALKDE